MNTLPEETRQQLWDLIYGLLPPEEAEPLCEQIASDPTLARAYSQAKLRSEVVAAAAKLDEARLPLDLPGESSQASPPSSAPSGAWSVARIVNVLASLAALALVSFVIYGYSRHASGWAFHKERDQLARQFVLTEVEVPQVVDRVLTQNYVVRVEGIDGTRIPGADVNYRLQNANGEVLLDEVQKTDDNGDLTFNLPGKLVEDQVTLKVVTKTVEYSPPVEANLFSLARRDEAPRPDGDGVEWFRTSNYFRVPDDNKLQIRPDALSDVYPSGSQVELSFQVHDGKKGVPADLRVAVVDESKLDQPRDFAEKEFDHLGAVWGARSHNGSSPDKNEPAAGDNPQVMSSLAAPAWPSQVSNNSPQVEDSYRRAVAVLDRRHEANLRSLGLATLAGGGVLLASLAALALLRLARDARLLVPTLASAIACILIGAYWMSAQVDQRGVVAFGSFSTRTGEQPPATEIAQNDLQKKKQLNEVREGDWLQGEDRWGDWTQSQPSVGPATPTISEPFPAVNSGKRVDNLQPQGVSGGGAGGPSAGGGEGALGGSRQSGGGGGFAPSVSGMVSGTMGRQGGFGYGVNGPLDSPKEFSFQRGETVSTLNAQTHYSTDENGRATVSFTLPPTPGRYRVFVEGRTEEGLGLHQWRFHAAPPPAAAAKVPSPD